MPLMAAADPYGTRSIHSAAAIDASHFVNFLTSVDYSGSLQRSNRSYMSLFAELKRRNVHRMALLYVVAAWLVMQVAEVLIGLVNLPDWLGPMLLVLLAIGFPIALIFSWFFEITPEGLSLEKGVPEGQSITRATGRSMDFIIIAILSAGLILFAYDKWWIAPPPVRSVAVLPFVAMSSGEDDGYFADGLTEEILNSLTQLPELHVTARTSSFFFKGKDVPMAEIANFLGVAHIVEGSVRRDGERLRITSQLIRVSDGFHLWSHSYDRTSKDIFAVQQDIAEKVAEALDVVLDDEARERMRAIQINDVEAFIAYQKGLEIYEKAHGPDLGLFEGLAIANTYFDKAIEAQPNLFAARVLSADRAGHLVDQMIALEEPNIEKVKDQFEVARTELDLAWRDSPSGNQRDILDLERTLSSDDWTGLTALIQKAMQPGDCPRINVSEFIQTLGFAQELAKKLEESLACNPMDADVIYRLAVAYSLAGRADESIELLDRAEAEGVKSSRFYVARIYAQIVAGRYDGLEIQDYWGGEILRALIQGNQTEAQQVAEKWWANPDIDLFSSLRIAAIVGDRAKANEFASRMDKYPGSALLLSFMNRYCVIFREVIKASVCRSGVPFDLEATPNFKARIEESGLQWPPVRFRNTSTDSL